MTWIPVPEPASRSFPDREVHFGGHRSYSVSFTTAFMVFRLSRKRSKYPGAGGIGLLVTRDPFPIPVSDTPHQQASEHSLSYKVR